MIANFLQSDGDCLYRIDRPILAGVLGSMRGASTISASVWEDRITEMNEIEIPESLDAQNRALQHSLVRRLLDDPVMYFDELTPREYDYWNSQAERLLQELHRATGLEIERRLEGVALLDLRWWLVGHWLAGSGNTRSRDLVAGRMARRTTANEDDGRSHRFLRNHRRPGLRALLRTMLSIGEKMRIPRTACSKLPTSRLTFWNPWDYWT